MYNLKGPKKKIDEIERCSISSIFLFGDFEVIHIYHLQMITLPWFSKPENKQILCFCSEKNTAQKQKTIGVRDIFGSMRMWTANPS